MKHRLLTILRVLAAIAATVVSYYVLHSAMIGATLPLGIDAPEHETVQVALDALVILFAFVIGGVVAARRFLIAATLLAVLSQWSSLNYWAEWRQTSLQIELARQWASSMLFVVSGVAGAMIGMAVTRHFRPVGRRGAT